MIKKKDYELIAEAYELIMEKAMPCTCTCESCKDEDCKKCSCKKCDCKGCKCSKTESLDECWDTIAIAKTHLVRCLPPCLPFRLTDRCCCTQGVSHSRVPPPCCAALCCVQTCAKQCPAMRTNGPSSRWRSRCVQKTWSLTSPTAAAAKQPLVQPARPGLGGGSECR